jgi:uncharacterized repeat protein (TIGR03803 family)
MKKQLLSLSLAFTIVFSANAQQTNLLNFSGLANGSQPLGSLMADGSFLYGMTTYGGVNGEGTVFKIMPNGTGYVKLLNFSNTTNGSVPKGSLISDGTYLYGMTASSASGFGTIFKMLLTGGGYVKLHDFNGTTHGSGPLGSLIYDGTYLYGMTSQAGTNGFGTIFKILPNGTGFVKLLDFNHTTNGSSPAGSLIYDGTFLYGMTEYGGTNELGTIFKIMPDGTGYVKLLDFDGAANGSSPTGSLFSDGTFLYGMTARGGVNNAGTVFKIMPNGTGYVKLLDFNGTANGSMPYGSLTSDGTFLYGMTQSGGTNEFGVIFKILLNGTGYVKLFDFDGTANGRYPYGSLIFDGISLYGMTESGGVNDLGTIFKYQLSSTTSINQNIKKTDLSIYPNPANQILNIKAEESITVTIVNLLGETVATQRLNTGNNSINLSSFTNGIYFIHNENAGVVKFIKE